jgi:hypothetical protein
VPVTEAQSTLVFPQAVVGGGYNSSLLLANPTGLPLDLTITFPTSTAGPVQRHLDPNATTGVPIESFFQRVPDTIMTGAVRITSTGPLLGVLDIDSQYDSVTIGAHPAATDFSFPQVANATSAATVTIHVYDPSGGRSKSATITLAANQQLSRLVSELVAGVATQVGGYIRIHSDQPIWVWEIYGSDVVMASGPPL